MTKKLISLLTVIGIMSAFATGLYAAEAPAKKKKQIPQGLYLTPQEAYDMKKANPEKVLFVDVRTPEELYFVGYPYSIDKNIPAKYIDYTKINKKGKGFASAKNKNVVAQFDKLLQEKGLTKEDPVIVICRSGSRSAKVATELYKNGYKKAYTVVTGVEGDKDKKTHHRTVNGWKNDGLPWGYKFNKDLFQYENPFCQK